MSEKEPSLTLLVGENRRVEATPENTTLYTFMGRTAIGNMTIENESLNHIFVVTSKPEQQPPSGMYFFAEFDDVFKDIAAFAVEHKFPMILNQRHLAECDLKAWNDRVDMQAAQFVATIPDSLPDK